MVQDTERSRKNFTLEDRQRRRNQQIEDERNRLRAQVEVQETSLMRLTKIVLDVAPDRLAEIGVEVSDAREFIKGLNK